MAEFENDEGQVVMIPMIAHESAAARYCRTIAWLVVLAASEAVAFAAFAVAMMKIGGVL